MADTLSAESLAAYPEDLDSVRGALSTLGLTARTFKTGSAGFSGTGKLVGADGRRYQVSTNAVLIGSKPDEAPKGAKS